MDNAVPGSNAATIGSHPAPHDGDSIRHGLMHRAMRHAQKRDLMQHMVERHAMHRRMMNRITRQPTNE